MLCGLLSDTHNNKKNLQFALTRFSQQGVEVILHAGDVTSVQTLQLLKDYNVWIAQGNMDRDPGLRMHARKLFGPGHFQSIHKLELAQTQIALLHSDLHPDWTSIIDSGSYDYVIYGHTHIANDITIGTTRIINPGPLSGTRYKAPSCAILDLTTDNLTWIRI